MPQRTYLAGKNATATFGAAMAVTDGSMTVEVETDEVTNLTSGGYFSSLPTIKKWSGSLDCVYDGDSPPSFNVGDYIESASVSVPSGPSVSGPVYITKMQYKMVTPKGAVRYTFDFQSEEAFTVA